VISDEWGERARRACLVIAKAAPTQVDENEMFIHDLYLTIRRLDYPELVHSDDLLRAFNTLPERESDPLANTRALDVRCKRFEIEPEAQPFKIGHSKRKRGYRIDMEQGGRFLDAFHRYVTEER